MKRADSSEDSGPRRGTLVNALRIGDERDGQIVLCYNRKDLTILCLIKYSREVLIQSVFPDTCHFERLTSKGLESDGEYDFHWTTVPAAVGQLVHEPRTSSLSVLEKFYHVFTFTI